MTDDAMFCVGCGYDLRNLPVDGPCPECGRAIAESLGGRRLAAADARWLTRLAIGQSLVTWGLHVALVCFCLLPMLGILNGILLSLGIRLPNGVVVVLLAMPFGFLIGLGVVWLGALLVTAPDPSESGAEPLHSARRLTRWGLAAAIVSIFLAILVTRLPVGVSAIAVARIVLQILAAVGLTIGILALLNCLAARATRIPDPDLARRTGRIGRVLRWVLPVFLTIVTIAASFSSVRALMPALAARGLDRIQATFGLAGVAVGCVVLFQLARLSTAARQYSRAFRAARDEARAARASGSVDPDFRRAARQLDTQPVAQDDDGERVTG